VCSSSTRMTMQWMIAREADGEQRRELPTKRPKTAGRTKSDEGQHKQP
jgi:hypothetical protein